MSAPVEDERRLLESVPQSLFVGGEWTAGAAGTFPVQDPSTGQVLADVADAGPVDGRAALDAAVAATNEWASTPPRARADVLHRAFQELLVHTDELALLMTLEMGKPLAEARGEVLYSAEFLRWFSEEACRIAGSWTTSPDGRSRLLTMRQPVGPCVVVTPWNFPLAMGTRKLGPALAAGCTVVVKPAPETPLTMLALADVLHRAGLPPGVLNVVPTSHAADLVGPLLRDPRTRKLSFTGSTQVGRQLAADAAPGLLRVSLELGGTAPFLVFEDADLDAAVEGALVAKMRNMGEACTAANRFLVHESVMEEFSRSLSQRMGALRVGRGTEPGVDVGPLVTEKQRDRVAGLVEDATDRGARVTVGGRRLEGAGWFYSPTVLTDTPADAQLLREEVFGPVAAVTAFSSEDEAVAVANDTEYGLVSYAYTRDLGRALRVAEALDCGMVGLNTGLVSNPAAPFGGVKASGLGREGGREGIQEYLEVKYVGVSV